MTKEEIRANEDAVLNHLAELCQAQNVTYNMHTQRLQGIAFLKKRLLKLKELEDAQEAAGKSEESAKDAPSK